jgi:hypothetical protein
VNEGQPLTGAEFAEALATFEHTAFRLELQPAYAEPSEADLVAMFLAGQRPDPRIIVPELGEWFDQVARQVSEGKRIERVRVHEDPPTGYQRFERWLDQWNLEAGEVMRYMTTRRALEVGLLPNAGTADWWLLDSSRLIVMWFDEEGHRIQNILTTDPADVIKACRWRDLAVHHSTEIHLSDVAA